MTYVLLALAGIGIGTLAVWAEQWFRWACDRIEARKKPKPPRFRVTHWNGCISEWQDTPAGRLAAAHSMLSGVRPWHKRPCA